MLKTESISSFNKNLIKHMDSLNFSYKFKRRLLSNLLKYALSLIRKRTKAQLDVNQRPFKKSKSGKKIFKKILKGVPNKAGAQTYLKLNRDKGGVLGTTNPIAPKHHYGSTIKIKVNPNKRCDLSLAKALKEELKLNISISVIQNKYTQKIAWHRLKRHRKIFGTPKDSKIFAPLKDYEVVTPSRKFWGVGSVEEKLLWIRFVKLVKNELRLN